MIKSSTEDLKSIFGIDNIAIDTTSFPLLLFGVRGRRKRSPGTLQTSD